MPNNNNTARSRRPAFNFRAPITGDPSLVPRRSQNQPAPSQEPTPTGATTREQSFFEREFSSTPFSAAGGEPSSSSFEREFSNTPFSTTDSTQQVDSTLLSNEFEDREAAGGTSDTVRLTWREDIVWTFLQVMLWICDEIAMSTDNFLRSRIWVQARLLFIQELREHITGSEHFCTHITVEKMQDAWDRLKRTYKAHYNRAHLQTGVGGGEPRWKYYDEMGQLLKNDASIHPDVIIESHNIQGQAGAFVTDNRNRNNEDEGDEEVQAARRARMRNVHHITKQMAKDKILTPAQRYPIEHIEEQIRLRENGLGTSPIQTADNNSSTQTANNRGNASTENNPSANTETVTGAGRTTRRNNSNQNNARRGPQRNEQSSSEVSAAQEQFWDRMQEHSRTFYAAMEEHRNKRKADSLEAIDYLISRLQRSREGIAQERRVSQQLFLQQCLTARQGQMPDFFSNSNNQTTSSNATSPIPSHSTPAPSSSPPPSSAPHPPSSSSPPPDSFSPAPGPSSFATMVSSFHVNESASQLATDDT